MTATPAHTGEYEVPYGIIWPAQSMDKTFDSSWVILYNSHYGIDSSFFHSKPAFFAGHYNNTGYNNIAFDIDKKFINLENSFKKQFNTLSEYYHDIDYESAKKTFAQSCSVLLELRPEVFSLELTSEKSIFYTIKKDSYTFFIQHFLNVIDEDEDEMIMSAFNGAEKLPSFAGTLKNVFIELNNIGFKNEIINASVFA